MALPLRVGQRLLRNRPVVAYTRKSREQKDEQIHSLERQRDAIEAFVLVQKLGTVDEWFEDEQSGKDFVRPGYDQLLSFCESHPQPKTAPGRVICLDYDRFSRPVDESLKVNPLEYQRQVIRLKDCGWELDFVLTPKSGNALLDGITSTIKASMAGEYLEKLSHNVRDGRRKGSANGNWLGGPAPFPTARYNEDDTTYKRPLNRHDRSRNGKCVLGPDLEHPEYALYWAEGAKMLIRGESLNTVARQYEAWGVPHRTSANPKWGWTAAHMVGIYTNPALVGKLAYNYRDTDGQTRVFYGDAKWGPLVDEKLFADVQKELERRKTSRRKARRREVPYFLAPVCVRCGCTFVTSTRYYSDRKGHFRRQYAHPHHNSKLPDDISAKMKEMGCRGWYVEADSAENVVRDLIKDKRLSKEFYQHVVSLMDDRDKHQADAKVLEDAAQRRIESLTTQKERLKRSLRFAETDEESGELMAEIRQVTSEITEAQTQLDQARLHSQTAQAKSMELLAMVEEAQDLIQLWDMPGDRGVEARQRLIDLWVVAVFIEVKDDPNHPLGRNSPRLLHVVLTTDPSKPLTIPLDGGAAQPDSQHLDEKNVKKYFTSMSYMNRADKYSIALTGW